jgi:beta-N-acetylhexosaminidase
MKKIVLVLMITFLLVGCSQRETDNLKDKNGEAAETFETIENNDVINDVYISDNSLLGDTTSAITNETIVDEMIAEMTLEEKVAQLFVVDFYTFNNYNDTTYLSDSLKERLASYPVGGVIYFSSNVVDREQVINFNIDLQNSARIPMFISVDEEGGIVRRLGKNSLMEMTEIETAAVIGETLDYDYAFEVGDILGSELSELGFNMDFAPVADVNTNPDNPVIGDRAYSDDPEVVAGMVASMINGLQGQNVAAVAKHFPGHGDTSLDTHTGDVYVEHDIERLKEIELVPFYRAIDEEVMGIMVAHIILPNVTGTDEPATVSYEIVTELLREEMNYEGLIITDAFTMDAISARYSNREAAVKAIEAGVDIILMPADFDEAYNGILEAVNNGVISTDRIDDSVKRILLTKYELGLFD